MTWHAKSLQTSYLTRPESGAHGARGGRRGVSVHSTTSWYFLDAVDVMAPAGTRVIVAFGDSITDGTASTINGDDRWPDVFARRMHAAYGNRVSVVNAGIGGNRIISPEQLHARAAIRRRAPRRCSASIAMYLSISGLSGVVFAGRASTT